VRVWEKEVLFVCWSVRLVSCLDIGHVGHLTGVGAVVVFKSAE
jgi:hypothetical protein